MSYSGFVLKKLDLKSTVSLVKRRGLAGQLLMSVWKLFVKDTSSSLVITIKNDFLSILNSYCPTRPRHNNNGML